MLGSWSQERSYIYRNAWRWKSKQEMSSEIIDIQITKANLGNNHQHAISFKISLKSVLLRPGHESQAMRARPWEPGYESLAMRARPWEPGHESQAMRARPWDSCIIYSIIRCLDNYLPTADICKCITGPSPRSKTYTTKDSVPCFKLRIIRKCILLVAML